MDTLVRPNTSTVELRPSRDTAHERRTTRGPRPTEHRAPHRLVRAALRDHVTDDFRPDIEGMRGVAVIVVVLFHAGLLGVDGGFIGVDVFFVLSGFLITRLLLRELESSGAIALSNFWARRARRILPAAALVVIVTLLAARSFLSPLDLQPLAADAVATGTFTSNFVFSHRLGDYFGAQLSAAHPSPFLHFWSLAVEEQFYLCWPLLLVVLTRRPRQFRRLLMSTIIVLAVVGFVIGAWLTTTNPSAAFYLLPARMGELLAGAALAAVGPAFRAVSATARAAVGWLGVLGIAVAASTYDSSTPFPGTAVILPVVATMLVIVAGGAGAHRWAPGCALRATPLQWIGRHSYAIYLWHWPVLVLAEAGWGPLSWLERCLAIGCAVSLAYVSLRLVEDPVRHAPRLARSPRPGLALGAALCVLMVLGGVVMRAGQPRLDGGTTAAAPALDLAVPESARVVVAVASPVAAPVASIRAITVQTATGPTAPGPTTLVQPDPPQGKLAGLVQSAQRVLAGALHPAPVPLNLRPSLGDARVRSKLYDDGCVNVGVNAKLQPCSYGVKGSGKLMVLFGDSHAAQWFEAVEAIAKQHGFELVVLTKAGCPVANVTVPTPVLKFACPAWRDRALAWMTENKPDLVIATNSYTQYTADEASWAAGADEAVSALTAVTHNVVVLGDNPVSKDDPPSCLSASLGDATACATPRDAAVRADRISGEVSAARNSGAVFVDTSNWFCTPTACPAVVGNLLILRDETHLTAPAAEFYQPMLAAAIAPAMAAASP
jgi:peptidoglycan/LPS O-acetylase OafA/YrhL